MSVYTDLIDEVQASPGEEFLSYLDSLPEKRRKQAIARARALGRLPAINEGAFTELGQSIANETLDLGRRFGTTIEEAGGGPGIKEYFEEAKSTRRHLEPDPDYRAMSLNPGNIARTLGSGVTQSALPIAVGAATTAITGGNALIGGAVINSLFFAQIYGDRVNEYREEMPNQSEKTIKGLAFISSAGESLIETVLGPEQLATGIAKRIATDAIRDTTKSLVKRVGAEIAKQAFAEGSEEVAQDFWNRCVLYAGTKQMTLPTWEEIGENFFGGAIPGGVLGGMGSIIEHKANKNHVPMQVDGVQAERSNNQELVKPTITQPEATVPDKASVNLVTSVAEELGMNVRFFDEEGSPEAKTQEGLPVNGMYDAEKNEFWIDRTDPEMDPLETLGHECYHKNHELFDEFNNLIKSGMNEAGKQALAETEDAYVKAGFEEGSGFTEFSADTFGKMWTDPEFWSEVTERAEKMNMGMGQKMLDALQEFIKTVRAKLKEIGTPAAKEFFDNMGMLRDEAVRITADIKRRNGTSTEAENVIGAHGSNVVQSVPVAEVNVDPARFQFKSKANKITGVDETNQISGDWDEKTAGNLYIWEDKTGKKFVVNGHHRLALAKSKNVQNINAIVDSETDGVTAEEASRNGVLINIRDGQGDIRDYAAFVRSSKLDDVTAEKEGILSREKGRTGYLIGRYASDNLYSMYRNGDINDARTATIADICRGDEALEAAGIRAANKNMSNAQLREFLKLLQNTPRQKSTQGDLFGFDDSAIKTAETLSKLALRHINQIKNVINSGKGAIKNPDGASVINVRAGKNSEQLLQEARKELDRWEHWNIDKELYRQLMEEAGLAEVVNPVEKPVEKSNEGRLIINCEMPWLTPEEDANDFKLIPEFSKEAEARAKKRAKLEEEEKDRQRKKAIEKTPQLDMEDTSKPVEKKSQSDEAKTWSVDFTPTGRINIQRYTLMPNGMKIFDARMKVTGLYPQEVLDVIEKNHLLVDKSDLDRLKMLADAQKTPPLQQSPMVDDEDIDTNSTGDTWGSKNKVVSTDLYEQAKARLKERLKNLNMGFDPTILSDGAIMAAYHVEAGARKFTDFSKRMVDDLGEKIRPYLKSIYESARRMPGMETIAKEMDSTESVDNFNFEIQSKQGNDISSVLREVINMQDSGQVKYHRLVRLSKDFKVSVKEMQERCEAEVVAMGREINAENISDDAKYQKLVDLYDRQPSFSKRTSTSIMNQAYSTPVPLSWILGKRIGLAKNSVYEPTAGTGMLTIAGDPSLTSVNEIDTLRKDILSKQGFQSVTSNDATKSRPNKKFDRIIMNPPFGAGQETSFDGYKLSKIDHIIAAKALEAMADNGRAAIIVGANTDGRDGKGRASLQDHVFMNYLYDKFNVKDNYIVSGDLYRKQGAGYPVRVMTIDGRRLAGEIKDHPTKIDVIKDWDTLYQNLKGELDHGELSETERSGGLHGVDKYPDNKGQNAKNGERRFSRDENSLGTDSGLLAENTRRPGVLGEHDKRATEGDRSIRKNQPDGRLISEPARSDGNGRLGMGERSRQISVQAEHGRNTSRNNSDIGRSGSERSRVSVSDGGKSSRSSVPVERIQIGAERGEFNNIYTAASHSTDKMEVLVPRFLAGAVADSLSNLQEKVGDIDAFVQKELGYNSLDELYKGLSDIQIDGVAQAIQAIKEHNGFILGDQTGIGKGRQCAALIRWAQLHDITPIFLTADTKLFTDMYDDGKNIGSTFNPLIIASKKDANINDSKGETIVGLPKTRSTALQAMLEGNSPYDVVFIPYSQLTKTGQQQQFLRDLASDRKCLIIMDEAHKASGDSATGRFFYDTNGILRSDNVNVLYASATFAKRPDNMALYFRTNIKKAVDNVGSLQEVLARGGVPLQQILSDGLASDGQYTRRERDFTGVKFEMRIAEPIEKQGSNGTLDKDGKLFQRKTAKQKMIEDYDRVANVLGKLVNHSNLVRDTVTKSVKSSYGRASTREGMSVQMASFSSVTHNFISQLLLASKCDVCVQSAEEAFKAAGKPVIALSNTLESVLMEYVDNVGLAVGEPMTMKYAHILENAVMRMYKYTEKARNGEEITKSFNPVEFGLIDAHEEIIAAIHDLDDIDLPISPIDYLKNQLEQKGIKTGEITGRGYTVDYSTAVPTLSRRTTDDKNKNRLVNDFNSGKMDAIILNKSGSTGLSIHAAAWFEDKRPRHMILAQPFLDISEVIQVLGRIMRTGQVVKPSYEFLSSPLTAEKRSFMILSKKLQSLNANTTANNKGTVSLGIDMTNKYGDVVAQQYLNENSEIASLLELSQTTEENALKSPPENIMTRLTGRMAVLSDAQQNEIFDDLVARYTDLIDFLKKTNNYDLEITVHDDWDVISGNESDLVVGDPKGSIFTKSVTLKEISLKEQHNIPAATEVRKEIKKNLGENRAEIIARLGKDFAEAEDAINNLEKSYIGSMKSAEFINDRKLILKEVLSNFKRFVTQNSLQMLSLNIAGENYTGTITGYRVLGKFNEKSPVLASKLMIDFAVTDTIGKISIPYSRFRSQEISYGSYFYSIEDMFTGEKKSMRTNRYVITGNLLRGLEYAEKGKIVSYKTNKGKVETALLLPKKWQPQQLARDPRNEIHTVGEAMEHLAELNGSIGTRDGFDFIHRRGEYMIVAPRDKRTGGKYYLDQGLLQIVGDFTSRGNKTMQTNRLTKAKLREAIAYMLNQPDIYLQKGEKSYSIKRHRQVNPIRESGDLEALHQELIDNKYEVRGNAIVNQEAAARIIGNGGMGKTIKMILDGDFSIGSDTSQRVMQLVLNSEEFKALDVNNQEKIANLYINSAGTDVARSLAARRLGVLNINDIKSIQAHVNAFMAKINKDNPHNDLRKQILEEFGFDINGLPADIIGNPELLDALIRKMTAERAGKFDKLYEFWINSILSAPTTHAANMIGNISNAGYELGIKRFAEAAINVVAKKKDAATFQEFKEVTKAIDWSNAFLQAKRAFNLETLTPAGKFEQARAAIGGETGRAVRLPGRLLRAADEFAKAIIKPIEAAAYAYRQAANMGLKGQDLQAYIEEQVKDEKSNANYFGNRRALELTFQENPGQAVNQLIRWRESEGAFGKLLKFVLPFIKTPANILRQGIRKSPVGSFSLAYDFSQIMMRKQSFNAEHVSLMAEQLLAWGTVAMLAGISGDDDDLPFLTGSSPSYGSAEQKFKANKIPPYSIRIGENYYSYKRIEPLSTSLAFIADGLTAYRDAKNGKDGTRVVKRLLGGVKQLVVEKSFLDSLGEINRIASDPERSGMNALTNFASSWMPNVVRQSVYIFEDNVMDNKSRAKGLQWWEDQFRIITNKMGVTKALPKYDYFGREIKKDSLADSGVSWKLMRLIPIQSINPDENMNRAELLIWRYNQAHPGEEYYPNIPAYYFQREGKKLYFEGENYTTFVQRSGQIALKQINNAFRHGLLDSNKPTEKDIQLIKNIFAKARKIVRDDMYKKRQYSE